jgi:hypothetical protein
VQDGLRAHRLAERAEAVAEEPPPGLRFFLFSGLDFTSRVIYYCRFHNTNVVPPVHFFWPAALFFSREIRSCPGGRAAREKPTAPGG